MKEAMRRRLGAPSPKVRALSQTPAAVRKLQQKKQPQRLVYKTFTSPVPPATSTMDAATQSAWDKWCDGRVNEKLADFADIIGEEMAKETKKLCEEIGRLRADLEILRQHKASVDIALKGKISPMVRSRDVA